MNRITITISLLSFWIRGLLSLQDFKFMMNAISTKCCNQSEKILGGGKGTAMDYPLDQFFSCHENQKRSGGEGQYSFL